MSADDEKQIEKTIAVLRAMSERELADYVDDAGDRLVQEARAAGKAGTALLRFLIEHEASRSFTLDYGVRAWLEIDAAEAVLVAVEHIDAIDRATFVAALATMDGVEAVDFLHARLASDTDVFAFVAHASKLVKGDDRFVDLALGRVHDDVRGAVSLLASIGTPRAIEEMNAIIERTPGEQTIQRYDLERIRIVAERAEQLRAESAQVYAAAQRALDEGNLDLAENLARFARDHDPENEAYRALFDRILQRIVAEDE